MEQERSVREPEKVPLNQTPFLQGKKFVYTNLGQEKLRKR